MRLIYKGNSHVIAVVLQDEETGAWFNAATVTAVMKTAAGASLSSVYGLSYQAGSNGYYSVLLPATLPVDNAVPYTLHVDATEDGIVGHWELPVLGKTRDNAPE